MNRLGAFARVPFLNRPVVLQAGIAANPSAFGDLGQERAGILLLQWLPGGYRTGPPFPVLDRRLHELIADTHGMILVLVHYASIGIPIVGAIVSLLDQRPSLLLFPLFCVDKLLDIPVPVAQGIHLGGTAGFAPRFHHVRDLA